MVDGESSDISELKKTIRAEFAARLKIALKEKNWSNAELARRASSYTLKGYVSKSSIGIYCKGIHLPNERTLLAISSALGLDPSSLLPTRKMAASIPSTANDKTNFEIRPAGNGRVWLYVDQAVHPEIALKITKILTQLRDA